MPGPMPILATAMRRRCLPLLALPARPAAATPAGIRFRILREGATIGTHRVAFTESEGTLTAHTEVAIRVTVLGMTVFRLSHDFTETWAGDRLRSVASRHDRNGTVTLMTARAEAGGLRVQGPTGGLRLPAEAAPLSWWDARRFAAPLFDSATGQPLRLELSRTALPGGVTRWRAAGDQEGEARYAADGHWLDWRTRGEDGSLVTYERV